MPTRAFHLPDAVASQAEARAADAGFPSVEAYLQSLVEADAPQELTPELEQAILDGLDSGPARDANDAFWDTLKRHAADGDQTR